MAAPDVDAVILTANAIEAVLLVPDKQPFVGRQSAIGHVLHETYESGSPRIGQLIKLGSSLGKDEYR
jgi:hypothetical protein